MNVKLNIGIFAMLALQPVMATTLLFDDFDGGGIGTGDGTSINGGFQLVGNANGTGTLGETGSDATITTATNSFSNTGIVSTNSFNTSSFTGISVTWAVTSQIGVDGGIVFLNTELLLQGGTGFRDTSYINFNIERTGEWILTANDGTNNVTLFNGGGLGGGIPDGYTVTLNLDASGWEVSASGFINNPAESGVWTGGVDYSDFQTDLHAAAMVQKGNSAGTAFLNVGSITVTGVPEPSSTLLLGLSGLGLLLRRRK